MGIAAVESDQACAQIRLLCNVPESRTSCGLPEVTKIILGEVATANAPHAEDRYSHYLLDSYAFAAAQSEIGPHGQF